MAPNRRSKEALAAPIRVLLVEDSPTDAQLLRLLLRAERKLSIVTATRISKGLSLLSDQSIDLVLLDLHLPDSGGIETLRRVHSAARNIPIVVLTSLDDDDLAIKALREGAQDFVTKGRFDRPLILRVIRHACERHRITAELQSLALTDMLTGLYNRCGFVTIAQEQLKLAHRMGHGVVLAFVDLNGMKQINDELGHEVGDQALVSTAEILRSTFRASDVIARLGGDEFVVLAIGVQETSIGRLRKRLSQSLARHNGHSSIPLSLSVGFVHHHPTAPRRVSIDELMMQADKAMYDEKQAHYASRDAQAR